MERGRDGEGEGRREGGRRDGGRVGGREGGRRGRKEGRREGGRREEGRQGKWREARIVHGTEVAKCTHTTHIKQLVVWFTFSEEWLEPEREKVVKLDYIAHK